MTPLTASLQHLDLERSPDLPPPADLRSRRSSGLVLSPDTRFIHASVGQWIRDNSFEPLTSKFLQIGMYQHEDMVNIACSIRTSGEFLIDLEHGLNVNPQTWVAVQAAFMRYARPINYAFVKASKVDLKPDWKHEYLFDEAEWQHQEQEMRDEARLRGQRREIWVQTMVDTLYSEENI